MLSPAQSLMKNSTGIFSADQPVHRPPEDGKVKTGFATISPTLSRVSTREDHSFAYGLFIVTGSPPPQGTTTLRKNEAFFQFSDVPP